ncbi:hypothetical protein ACTU3I_15525 [Microbacterium sp. RD1]|uniref:hypothetical protein n=1 Tax=Microbacterium sp. RD1 TaxID=3457313 RepID=UPI003FA5E458
MHATATAPSPVSARRPMSPLAAGLLAIGGTALAMLGGLLVSAALLAGAAFAVATAVMTSL